MVMQNGDVEEGGGMEEEEEQFPTAGRKYRPVVAHDSAVVEMFSIDLGSSSSASSASNLKFNILSSSRNHITVMHMEGDNYKPNYFTFIHADPGWTRSEDGKRHMRNFIRTDSDPWCIIGDFNAIRFSHEKQGGRSIDWNQVAAFNEFINEGGLIDLEFKGSKFTWSNNQVGSENILERLDRGLSNGLWRLHFPKAQIIHEAFLGSDHKPLVLNTEAGSVKQFGSFRFESKWTKVGESKEIVTQVWREKVRGSSSYNLKNHLKICSTKLRRWSRNVFGNCREKIERLTEDINELSQQGLTPKSKGKQEMLQRELSHLWDLEEMHWHQRARINWLNYGDRNTNFFHSTATNRKQRNQILRIQDIDGMWLEDDEKIKSAFNIFFRNAFKRVPTEFQSQVINCISPVVTAAMKRDLDADVTREEVKRATFELGSIRSPGPDGYPGLFFQHYWDIIGEEVFGVVYQFFNTFCIPNSFNDTIITLIPKNNNPHNFLHYRPISLCNFIYKIISKTLANRIKTWIDSLISDNQSAFIPSRAIQDNIIVAHEVFHHLRPRRGKRKGLMALKVDFKKAYDMVDWNFLERIMQKMDFPQPWIKMIMHCVTSVSYSLNINGTKQEYFKPTRGIRQGDPISPYLFLFISNSLSLFIKDAEHRNLIRGVKLNRNCPTLTHILFADDTMLFGEATIEEARNLKLLLSQFERASGQVINLDKSNIRFSRDCDQRTKQRVKCILGMEEMRTGDKYLGFPSLWGRSKTEVLNHILDRVQAKAQGWKQKALSIAGREVMIKSVLTAIPNYLMHCVKFPKTLCKQINSLMAGFWWGNDPNKSAIHWLSWRKITLPKDSGGMGFRDMEEFNLSLLAKQAWRIMENTNSLCYRILKGLYFPKGSFLDAEKGRNPSWVWRSLVEGKRTFQKDICWKVGNGKNIRAWEDPWVPGLPGFKISTPKPHGTDIHTVEDLKDEYSGRWDSRKLINHFNSNEIDSILQITTDVNRQDTLMWKSTSSGKYTVKEGYIQLKAKQPGKEEDMASSSYHVQDATWKDIWKLDVTPKIRNFMWKAMKNILPTRETLFRRRVLRDPTCQICHSEPETLEHTLFFCNHAAASWMASQLTYKPRRNGFPGFHKWMEKVMDLNRQITGGDISTCVATMCWNIWISRNEYIFDNKPIDPLSTTKRAERTIRDNKCASSINKIEKQQGKWRRPEGDQIKINCDGSFAYRFSEAGVAAVARDSHGRLRAAKAINSPANSPLEAELLAIALAVDLIQSNFAHQSVIIESDSEVATSFLNMRTTKIHYKDWRRGIDLSKSLSLLPNVSIHFCPRSSNTVADWLARNVKGKTLTDVERWVTSPHGELHRLLYHDAQGS